MTACYILCSLSYHSFIYLLLFYSTIFIINISKTRYLLTPRLKEVYYLEDLYYTKRLIEDHLPHITYNWWKHILMNSEKVLVFWNKHIPVRITLPSAGPQSLQYTYLWEVLSLQQVHSHYNTHTCEKYCLLCRFTAITIYIPLRSTLPLQIHSHYIIHTCEKYYILCRFTAITIYIPVRSVLLSAGSQPIQYTYLWEVLSLQQVHSHYNIHTCEKYSLFSRSTVITIYIPVRSTLSSAGPQPILTTELNR